MTGEGIAMLGQLIVLADNGWHHMDDGWWVVMVIGMAIFWGLVILAGIWLVRELAHRREHAPDAPDALQLLDRRLAEGTISLEDYHERRAILADPSRRSAP